MPQTQDLFASRTAVAHAGSRRWAYGASNSGLAALKWVALLAMTLDHANRILLAGQCPWANDVGRIAFVLFGAVLAVNLTRPSKLPGEAAHQRSLRLSRKLALWGLIAQPLHMLAFQTPVLNVMFTLAVAAALIGLLQSPHRPPVKLSLALAGFVLAGLVVDFAWPGLLWVLACCTAFAFASLSPRCTAIGAAYALVLLALWQHSAWVLVGAVVLLALWRCPVGPPRMAALFYAYYPLHLAALLLASRAANIF